MEKIKSFMKRPVNFNLVCTIGFTILPIIIAVFSFVTHMSLKNSMNNYSDMIGRDDVAGGYLAVGGIFVSILGSLADAVILAFGLIIPLIFSLLVIGFAVIAKLIYSSEKRKRIIAYRIIMGIDYFLTIVFFTGYSLLLFYDSLTGIIASIIDVFVLLGIVLCIRNTYTKRIFENYKE